MAGLAVPVYPTEASNLKSYEFSESINLYMRDENAIAETININDWLIKQPIEAKRKNQLSTTFCDPLFFFN